MATREVDSSELPAGCSVALNSSGAFVAFNRDGKSGAPCGAGVTATAGEASSLVNVSLRLALAADGATISLSAPADGAWFGVGFATQFMANSPYAIVVDGAGAVSEHALADHAAGVRLNRSLTVLSNSVADGVRTVVCSRPLAGLTPQHHTFDWRTLSLGFIAARGSTSAFGYHRAKTAATLALWPQPAAPQPGGTFGLFGSAAPCGGPQGTCRNNFDGEVGYDITPTRPLILTALGRATDGGPLRAAAAVNVWDVATKQVVATATVGPAAAVEGGFAYAPLPAEVTLAAGGAYRVTQACSKGMADAWVDTDANAAAVDAGLATVGMGRFSQGGGFPDKSDEKGVPGRWAGIATLRARVAADLHPSAAPACVCSLPAAPFGQGKGTIKYLPSGEVPLPPPTTTTTHHHPPQPPTTTAHHHRRHQPLPSASRR